jgi:hypothetical protein
LEAYRLALKVNHRSFRVRFGLDDEGALILRARIPLERLDDLELEYLLAEFYDTVETAFRPLLAAGFET